MSENTKPKSPNPKQAPDITNSSTLSLGGAGVLVELSELELEAALELTPRKLPNFLAKKPF